MCFVNGKLNRPSKKEQKQWLIDKIKARIKREVNNFENTQEHVIKLLDYWLANNCNKKFKLNRAELIKFIKDEFFSRSLVFLQ
jgi:hypothetical protein